MTVLGKLKEILETIGTNQTEHYPANQTNTKRTLKQQNPIKIVLFNL
jgi:hypothetical protein